MKSALALVVSLAVLSLAVPHAQAQTPTPFNGSTPNINPDPVQCCKCISWAFTGDFDQDDQNKIELKNDTSGNYWFAVLVAASNQTNCPDKISYVIRAEPLDEGIPIVKTGILNKGDSITRYFKIDAANARFGSQWRVRVACGTDIDSSDDPFNTDGLSTESRIGCDDHVLFTLGGCKACACPDGKPSMTNYPFSVTIPTTMANGGDTEGELAFHTYDFSNPGPSALTSPYSPNIQVNRDGNNHISNVQIGINTIQVAPAAPTILAEDPNAFTVTHKDSLGNPFRTTTIAMVEENGVQRLRMDSTFEGAIYRHERVNPMPGVFVMEKGKVVAGVFEALSRETLTATEPSAIKRVRRVVIEERSTSSSAWEIVSDSEKHLENQYGGWLLTKQIDDPDGLALISTWSYYQPGDITGPLGSTIGLGRVKKHTRYDGFQAFYTYGLNEHSVATPYRDNPVGKVETTTWDQGTKTKTRTTVILGQLVSKSSTEYTETTTKNIVYTSAHESLVTITDYYPSGQDFGGKPSRIVHPNGTITTYTYSRNEGGGYTRVSKNGSTTDGATVAKGTCTTTMTNSRGTLILSKTEAIGHGTGSMIIESWAVTSVDNLGRALVTAHYPTSITLTGEVASATGAAWTTTTEYNCCGVAKETDAHGISTFYAYDHLQRQIKFNRLGVTTETIRKGLTTENYRYVEAVSVSLSPTLGGTSATLVSKTVSNLTGTLKESWSPDPTSNTPGALVKFFTSTTYQPAAGLSTRTVTTTPDNQSQTTDSLLDGRAFKSYGSLAPSMEYNYSVNTIGEVISKSYVDGSSLRETSLTQFDWSGRTLSVTFLDGATSVLTYNAIGQMVKSIDQDGVATLYAYNTEGERVISAIDLNQNDFIDYGVDTVSFSESEPATIAGKPGQQSINKVWQPGDTNAGGGTVVNMSFRSSDGLYSTSQSLGVANPSISETVLGGNGNLTITSTAPDGTKQVQSYTAGLLAFASSVNTANQVISSMGYAYDILNRPSSSVSSRTGTTTTVYRSATSDAIASVTDPGSRTTAYTYDVRGRRTVVDAPDSVDADGNPLLNVTTTSYNPDSTVAETTGDQTYRTTHTYDYAQRQVTMTTYGSATATTTWTYSPTRGFLTRKAYHDGKGTDYTYTAAGRLSTRGWARAVGSSYAYDAGGRLISTTYSDDTPDVSVAYDCLGRQTSQSNGIATSTYAYDQVTLNLDSETISYELDSNTAGPEFIRVHTRSRDNLSRDTGWLLKNGATTENSVTYAYGPTDGRLASVGRGDTPVPQSFNYSYLANSNLLATVTGPIHTVINTWESTRDVLASKENKVGATLISGYTYNVNHLGQRTGVSQAGTAFQAAQSVDWGYNNKGEVVKADSSVNASDRSYQYDGIGNRLKSVDSLTLPTSNIYTPNVLNQYSAVGSLTPGYDDDGNMTGGPLPANLSANSTLTWDAENRLISTSVNSVTTTYLYDSQSRRIAQTTGSATTLYLYDGWNPIAEYSKSVNVPPTLQKTYTWGMDLSGSIQGAGGVGGLLAVTDSNGIWHTTFDGNGNVSEYLDSSGAIVAHYEYDPYGRETVANGTKAGGFAHRFSTKNIESSSGLYYYGYRYYDSYTGRWLSRDLIREAGGSNLYAFSCNRGVNFIDYLGLLPSSEEAIKAANSAVTTKTASDRALGEKEVEKNRIAYLTEMNVDKRPNPNDISKDDFYAAGDNWRVQTKYYDKIPNFYITYYMMTAGRESFSVIYCDSKEKEWSYTTPEFGLSSNDASLKQSFIDSVNAGNGVANADAGAVSLPQAQAKIKEVKDAGNIPKYLTHSHNVRMEYGDIKAHQNPNTKVISWWLEGETHVNKIGKGVLSWGDRLIAPQILPVLLIAAGEDGEMDTYKPEK